MEDLLKMPSQYVDQVMYSVKAQQRYRSLLNVRKEKNSEYSTEQEQEQPHPQQQTHQQLRSVLTSTTRSTTSASNDS